MCYDLGVLLHGHTACKEHIGPGRVDGRLRAGSTRALPVCNMHSCMDAHQAFIHQISVVQSRRDVVLSMCG